MRSNCSRGAIEIDLFSFVRGLVGKQPIMPPRTAPVRTPGTTVRIEVYTKVPMKEFGIAPFTTFTTDNFRMLDRSLYIRLKTTAADPMASIAFLLSSWVISVTKLATIVVMRVEMAHVHVPRPMSKGTKEMNVSAAARISVIRSSVKGIAHSIGGSLTVLTIAAIKGASPCENPYSYMPVIITMKFLYIY